MVYKLLLIALIICSCSSPMMETDLYFGQSKPDGGMITPAEWTAFKEDQVAKIFKDGSTVFNATGNWFDPDRHQLIAEPTYVVIYFHKRSALMSGQIDSLCEHYKLIFHQQSVLRIDKKVKAKF